MSQLTPVGAVVQELDVMEEGVDRFPFFWWAAGAKFKYPSRARHLFIKCGSAAEAFFLSPFLERQGLTVAPDSASAGGVQLVPQFAVGKYRVDFAVLSASSRLAVEIDGMTFHHKTEDQVEGDYIRARRLICAGYTVVRFTAREAFTDAGECWRQIDAILEADAKRATARAR